MYQNEIKNLFPTPLYIGNIGVNEDDITYINSLDFELTYLKNGLQTQDRHILLHKELTLLKKKIDDEFEIYAREKLRINKKHNALNDYTQFNQSTFKYNKNTWSTETTAKTQVEKLNRSFRTNKFGYIKIDGKG